MKRLHILSALVLIFALAGCDDYLTVPEKGKVIPETIEHYNQLLSNFNKFTNSSANAYFYSDDIKLYADETSRIPWNGVIVEYENGYLFKDHLYDDPDDADQDWNNFYDQIYVCNQVIENIDEAVGDDEVLRAQTKGKALAQRAYAYFMLVNLYSKHYDESSYDADLGVPLHTVPDINAEKARATVKEVYDLIEEDLLEAAELVPEEAEFNYHPDKSGVYGLLARMYLYQGDWENARDYANQALQRHSFLYDYKTIDFIPGAPPQAGMIGYPREGTDNEEAVWFKKSGMQWIYNVAVYMTGEHKALYDDGDRRLYFRLVDNFVFGPNAHGKVIFTKEFYYKAGITTPELYLIRAESNARLNNPSAAIADLNTLRQNRFDGSEYTPYSDNKTSSEALDLVLKERRVELFMHPLRLFDLKRLNKDPEFAKTITRSFDGQTYTIEPGDNNYVLAIPKKVMNLNSKIEQNSRDNRN